MTERWQRELMKLRGVQAPQDLWERVKVGPGPETLPMRSRARLAAAVIGLAGFLAAAVLVWMVFAPSRGTPTALHGSDTLTVPPVGETEPVFLADGHPVFVVHHEDGAVSVIDAFSTHVPWGIHELVGWCPSSRTFDEPEHGARFNEFGTYLTGPAATDLVTYRIFVVRGEPRRVRVIGPKPAASRGSGSTAAVAGPVCQSLSDLVAISVDPSLAWQEPADAVAAAPEGWIAVQGILRLRAGESARLCPDVEGGQCRSGATVEGIDAGGLLDTAGLHVYTERDLWLARVEAGHLVDLTRTLQSERA